MDWGDVNNKDAKPDWMRQKPAKPCECKICFFCKEGITNGIYHKTGAKRRCKVATNKTSRNKKQRRCAVERENFGTSGYCVSCYRKCRAVNPELSRDVLRQRVESKVGMKGGRKPRLGCLNCGE